MKRIQDINLFFADNFNRYIDNITIRELIDVYNILLEQKKIRELSETQMSIQTDIKQMKLPLLNVNLRTNVLNDILEDYVLINTTTITTPVILPIKK